MSEAKREADCSREVAVLTDGLLPVTIECVQCAAKKTHQQKKH